MKAVILAAGKGTRMGDLTREIPKPMLCVQKRPILEHIMEGIAASGVRQFCIITGWHAEVIEDHFGDGSRWGWEVTYVRQVVQDGTGKAPELAKDFVGDEDFILTYGDILVEPDTYAQMIGRFAEGSDFSGLITVTQGEDVTKGGLNFFDETFCLMKLVEKASKQQLDDLRQEGLLREGQPLWYNAGIYIFKPALFEYTARLKKSPRNEYELTDAISAMVDDKKRVAGLKIGGRWVDVRDPDVLLSLT